MKEQTDAQEFAAGCSQMDVQQSGSGRGKDFKGQAREVVHDVKQRAGQQLGSLSGWLQQEGRSALMSQTSKVAESLHGFASAAQCVAEQLESRGEQKVAGYALGLGAQVDRLADYLNEGDFKGMLEGAEVQIRRHKEVAFGALFVGGLLIARLLKASGKRMDPIASRRSDFLVGEEHEVYSGTERNFDAMERSGNDANVQSEFDPGVQNEMDIQPSYRMHS